MNRNNDKQIYILGFGCAQKGEITLRTLDILKKSDHVFVRTMRHPAAEILDEYHISYEAFDSSYDSFPDFDTLYQHIADTVLQSDGGIISYIVPGSAIFAERAVQLMLKEEDKYNITLIPAVSFLDGIFSALKIDALNSFKLLDALSLDSQKPDLQALNVICQVYDNSIASDVKISLMRYYPDEHEVYLITEAAGENEIIEKLPLYQIDQSENINHLTTLVVPTVDYTQAKGDFTSLAEIIKTLRSENGCPWDKAQTHQSLTPFLIEESYEVIDAIKNRDDFSLCDELGDVLMQVLLHAQIAAEEDSFDIYDVIDALAEKMIRRHPHIFKGEKLEEDIYKKWDELKKKEKNYSSVSEEMRNVPKSFPPLLYAQKIQTKAAKVGFDFPDVKSAFEKIYEETRELEEAIEENDTRHIKEEGGDLLFSVVNVLRLLHLYAHEAMTEATEKFYSRFEQLEKRITSENLDINAMSQKEMDLYWKK